MKKPGNRRQSKETVVCTLTDIKEDGLIQIAGSKITIVKPDKLSNMRNRFNYIEYRANM